MDFFRSQRLAASLSVPAEVIEKDFLIEAILFYLARTEVLSASLVFRGGTALKKIYFPDYRFSEDLDFLMPRAADLAGWRSGVAVLFKDMNSNYPYGLTTVSETLAEDRLQILIGFDIVREIRGVKQFKIDVLKETLIPASKKRRVQFSYPEFQSVPIEITCYDLESVASDKISRVLDYGREPRDLYDLWYLLKAGIDLAKVRSEFKKKVGYRLPAERLVSEIRHEDYRRMWEVRLRNQVVNLPPFDQVVEALAERLI